MTTYNIGIEELSAGFNMYGNIGLANGILAANFGELNPEDVRGRLLAGTHSLMAKKLVFVEKDGSIHLQDEFRHVLKIMAEYEFSLRLSYGLGDSEQILTYYFFGKEIVKHENFQAVVQNLSLVTNQTDWIEDGIRFLLKECKDFDTPQAIVRQSELDSAKAIAATKPKMLPEHMKKIGIPDKTAKLMADDLTHPDFRGSVLRVERRNGDLISDRGFLTLMRKPRVWIFPIQIKDGEPFARIQAGSKASIKNELKNLIG